MTAHWEFYHAAWQMCKADRLEPPAATFVQQLVQAWRELAKRAGIARTFRTPVVFVWENRRMPRKEIYCEACGSDQPMVEHEPQKGELNPYPSYDIPAAPAARSSPRFRLCRTTSRSSHQTLWRTAIPI